MRRAPTCSLIVFLFNDTATTEIYTLSLHDALPICGLTMVTRKAREAGQPVAGRHSGLQTQQHLLLFEHAGGPRNPNKVARSEEHTSELQSRQYLVCRLLLEKKNPTLSALMPSCRTK